VAKRLALCREPAALGVREAQTPATELLAQDAVLLLDVLEELELAAVHPAREHQQQELGSGATDIFGNPTVQSSGFGRLDTGATSRKS
jgi:hypothetical protein